MTGLATTEFTGNIELEYNAFGQRAEKVAGSNVTWSLYDQDGNLTVELDGSGNTLNTFAWGPDGLTERYQHQNVGVPYINYLYDPDGNVVHRVRSVDPNTSSGDAVFTIDTVLWDDYGRLHADIDTISGGFHTPDMVGYGGQSGRYTDVETLTDPSSGQIAAGTYLATEGPGGAVFYNPAGGIALARLHADDANEYADEMDAAKGSFKEGSSFIVTSVGFELGGPAGGAIANGAYTAYMDRLDGIGPKDALIDGAESAGETYVGGKLFEYGGKLVGQAVEGLSSSSKRLVVPAPRLGIMPHDDGIIEIKRGGGFRKSAHELMIKNAPRNAQGQMICPTCGKVIPDTIIRQTVNGPVERVGYDGDHYPDTWAERVEQMQTMNPPPNRKYQLDEYNRRLRAQCPDCNQGHAYEGKPGDFATSAFPEGAD